MKIMILAPPNTLKKQKKESASFDDRITPLDLAYIGAVLEKKHEVKILDALARSLDEKEIIREIENFDPEIICLTAFDRCRWGIDSANKLSEKIKNRKVGLIWSYEYKLLEDLMKKNDNIDFVVYGDPEYTLLDLANKKHLNKIDGLIYRKNKKIIRNKPREFIKSLDELPFPARHLLNLDDYNRMPHEQMKSPCYDMLVTRGCPYLCTFCLIKIIAGRNRRERSPEKVVEEMGFLKKRGAKQIHFQDPVFTLKREWMMDICKLIIRKKLNLVWSCQTRVGNVDEELLRLMKKAGCGSILYGVESLNQDSLDKIKKGVKVNEIINALKLTKKVGIEARCSLMVGLPGETANTVKETIRELTKLNPAFAQFHTTTAFPGTELYEKGAEYGKISESKKVKKFDLTGKPFIPKSYKNEKEVIEVQKKAYKKFYLRPEYLLKRMFNLKEFRRNLKGLKLFLKLNI